MRTQAVPLGIAAAMAFSSAAGALPCAHTSSITTVVACSAGADGGGAVGSGREVDQEPAAGDPLATDAAQPADLVELEAFAESAVKITNLQATMTSNRYVAGHIPPVPRASSIEELMMYAPDYMSVKWLPRIPKRKPVGVGLVTVRKPPVKNSDTTSGATPPPKPAR